MDDLRVSNVQILGVDYGTSKGKGIIRHEDMSFTFGIDDNTVTLLADEIRVFSDKTLEVYREGKKIFESPFVQLIIKDEGKEVVMVND